MASEPFAYLRIIRPYNVLIGLLSIYVGAWVAGQEFFSESIFLACLSGSLILAGGNVVNDLYDIEIDRVNKAFRVLPSGRLSPLQARNFSIILFVLGIFLSIFLSELAAVIAVTTTLALYLYSSRLKRTVLWGNLSVSLLTVLAFVYGGLSARHWERALIPGALAFFFHLGREIIKDMEDREADYKLGLKTLATFYGNRVARTMASVVLLLLIVVSFLPYMLGIYGKGYLWIVLFGVDIVILASLIYLWSRPEPGTYRQVSAILKADMMLGLVAVVFGTLH